MTDEDYSIKSLRLEHVLLKIHEKYKVSFFLNIV